MIICFFHKKQIINFSSSTLRGRAYPRLAPKHIQRQLLKTALQMRMSGNAQYRAVRSQISPPKAVIHSRRFPLPVTIGAKIQVAHQCRETVRLPSRPLPAILLR